VLGLGVVLLTWTAAIRVSGTVQVSCVDVFDGTDDLTAEVRAEILARCIATAGPDEIEPAVVLRRHPKLYPFAIR
jgi:hypothetical protein